MTVRQVGAVKANNYMYLQSIVTLLVSAVVLGEKITLLGCTGILLIIGGLWLGENINNFLRDTSERVCGQFSSLHMDLPKDPFIL